MLLAKQSTAVSLTVGPILDSAGVEYTSAVIGDLSLTKNGGTPTALAASATLTHVANGQYTLALTTGNTDTLGVIQVTCNKSTYQMPMIERHVVPANVYDSLIGGSDNLQVDAVQISGDTQAADTLELFAEALDQSTGQLDNGSFNAVLPTNFATLVISGAGKVTVGTNDDKTGYSLASGGLAAVTAWTVDITGSLSGSVGSVTGAVGSVTSAVTVGTINANVITAASIAADAGVEIAAAVWDRVLTGATHNIANSAGRRLRQVDAAAVVDAGTSQAGGATSITLAATASSTNDIYKGDRVEIIAGTGAGENAIITAYNGTTKVATVTPAFVITPDATSEYQIVPATSTLASWAGTAVTGDGDWAGLEASIAALNDLDSTAVQAAAAAALTAYDPPTNAEFQARTLAAADYATSTALSALSSIFTGITSLGDWIRRIVRKDAGSAGMVTAEIEINTGGTATFTGTSDSLEAIRDRGDAAWTTGSGGGSGSGARTVTVTVTDGTDPLQNATVRMTEGVNSYIATTNVSGVATFNLDDATYTVAISKPSYSYAGTTLAVDGDEAATYAMSAVVVPAPSDPALCAVTIPILDQYGVALADEVVEIRFNEFEAGATTTALVLSPPPTLTSDVDGLVEVTLLREASYSVFYGQDDYQRRLDFTVPDAASYTVGE